MRLLFLLTIGLIGTGILIWLGTWQVQRLAWKQELLAGIEAKITADPVRLPANPAPPAAQYLAVTVDGTIMPGEIHVLVSRKNIGAGYRVISPFRTQDGRRILLDRGFVRQSEIGEVRQLGPIALRGNLHWPDEIDSYTPEPDIAANIWYGRDIPAMATALDTEPVLMIAADPTDRGIDLMPIGTDGIPNDHLQYAITWFSLAAIWAGMSLFFITRPRASNSG